MKLVVINRDCDTERLKEFRNANAHIDDIRRFSAVEGTTLDREELIAGGIIKPDLSYSKGALGSAMSHILLWNAVLENDESACIFEDDAILCRNFISQSEKILSELPEDWDIILWGSNADISLTFELLPGVTYCVARFNETLVRLGAEKFRKLDVRSLPFRLYHTLGICGYAISPKGARRMLDVCLPLHNKKRYHFRTHDTLFNTSLDHVMSEHYESLASFVSFPALCITKNEHAKSTIINS